MRNLRKFKTREEYNQSVKDYPQVSLIVEDSSINYAETPPPIVVYPLYIRICPMTTIDGSQSPVSWVEIKYTLTSYLKTSPDVINDTAVLNQIINIIEVPGETYKYGVLTLSVSSDCLYELELVYLGDNISADFPKNIMDIDTFIGIGGLGNVTFSVASPTEISINKFDAEKVGVTDSHFKMHLHHYQSIFFKPAQLWRNPDIAISMRCTITDSYGGSYSETVVSPTNFFNIVDKYGGNLVYEFEFDTKGKYQFQNTIGSFITASEKEKILVLIPETNGIPQNAVIVSDISDYVENKISVSLGVGMDFMYTPIDWIAFEVKLDHYGKSNPGILVDSKTDEYVFVYDGNMWSTLNLELGEDHLYDMTITYNTDSASKNFAGNLLGIDRIPLSVYPDASVDSIENGWRITGIDPSKTISAPITYPVIALFETPNLQINTVGITASYPELLTIITSVYGGSVQQDIFDLSKTPFINQNNFYGETVQVELLLKQLDPNNSEYQFKEIPIGSIGDIQVLESHKDKIVLEYNIPYDIEQKIFELIFEPYAEIAPDLKIITGKPNSVLPFATSNLTYTVLTNNSPDEGGNYSGSLIDAIYNDTDNMYTVNIDDLPTYPEGSTGNKIALFIKNMNYVFDTPTQLQNAKVIRGIGKNYLHILIDSTNRPININAPIRNTDVPNVPAMRFTEIETGVLNLIKPTSFVQLTVGGTVIDKVNFGSKNGICDFPVIQYYGADFELLDYNFVIVLSADSKCVFKKDIDMTNVISISDKILVLKCIENIHTYNIAVIAPPTI